MRKKLLILVVLLCLALSLCACGETPAAAPETPAPTESPDPYEPVHTALDTGTEVIGVTEYGEVRAARVEDILDGEVDGLYIDELLSIIYMMNAYPENLGISPSAVRYSYEGSSTYYISVDGMLFGRPAYGSVCSVLTPGDYAGMMGSADLYSYDIDFFTCRDLLLEAFGEPYLEGEQPYAEANGGALLWAYFDTPSGYIRIAQGSNNSWMEIDFHGLVD